MNNIASICRRLASDFNELANAFELEETRINVIETQARKNTKVKKKILEILEEDEREV